MARVAGRARCAGGFDSVKGEASRRSGIRRDESGVAGGAERARGHRDACAGVRMVASGRYWPVAPGRAGPGRWPDRYRFVHDIGADPASFAHRRGDAAGGGVAELIQAHRRGLDRPDDFGGLAAEWAAGRFRAGASEDGIPGCRSGAAGTGFAGAEAAVGEKQIPRFSRWRIRKRMGSG